MYYGQDITLDDVEIGSRIAVNIAGETFILTIDELEEDVKNDRPGGGGKTDDGDERWFYMEQVTRVIRKSPAPVAAPAPAPVEAPVNGLLTIRDSLVAAALASRTEASQAALMRASELVSAGKLVEARKILVPLRTRQARAAIAAIKAL